MTRYSYLIKQNLIFDKYFLEKVSVTSSLIFIHYIEEKLITKCMYDDSENSNRQNLNTIACKHIETDFF